MAKTKHWDDPTKYALHAGQHGFLPRCLQTGAWVVIEDWAGADAAIQELLDAKVPIVRSERELDRLIEEARGKPIYGDEDGSTLGLYRDRWGRILLRAIDIGTTGPLPNPLVLKKYEALHLADCLRELAMQAPEPRVNIVPSESGNRDEGG
jgi:hypothetical protein